MRRLTIIITIVIIAASLGIKKPSLYHHIEAKEDLLYDICRSSLEQIRRDVEAAIEKVPAAAIDLPKPNTTERHSPRNAIREAGRK